MPLPKRACPLSAVHTPANLPPRLSLELCKHLALLAAKPSKQYRGRPPKVRQIT